MKDFITEEMLEIYSLDWFAVDQSGIVVHFNNAGSGFIPMTVRISDSDRLKVLHYIKKMKPKTKSIRVEACPPGNSEKEYYYCFDKMSKVGLYSYCFPIDVQVAKDYHLVTRPEIPLNIADMNKEIAAIVSRTYLLVQVQNITTISRHHFEIE
jgi:hypothetical protein